MPEVGLMPTPAGRRAIHAQPLFCGSVPAQTSEALDPKLQSSLMTELDLLKKPEYIHVLLNHLPIYGAILGAFALSVSLILRSRGAQITALSLTLLAGVSAYPVFVSGQRAYKTIRGLSDDDGAYWLDEHMDRAEKTIDAFYILAVFAAAAGLLLPIKWPKSACPLAALTLIVAIFCAGVAVYIALPGGRVRHPEFRPAETANPASESDRNDKQ